MEFLESSAKTGLNVDKIFHKLSEKLLDKIEANEIDPKNEVYYYLILFNLFIELWNKIRKSRA